LDEVRLPDLQTIRRFSIAVRQEHAPLSDVLDALRADLDRLEREAAPRRESKRSTTRSRSKSSARRRSR
jgi:hypothetical protein